MKVVCIMNVSLSVWWELTNCCINQFISALYAPAFQPNNPTMTCTIMLVCNGQRQADRLSTMSLNSKTLGSEWLKCVNLLTQTHSSCTSSLLINNYTDGTMLHSQTVASPCILVVWMLSTFHCVSDLANNFYFILEPPLITCTNHWFT